MATALICQNPFGSIQGFMTNHEDVPSGNHLSRRQLYWQKLCATHNNKIPCGESSQIDGLEAGKITYEYLRSGSNL